MVGQDWFCEKVLSGKEAVKVIWEDDLVLAFHHPRPRANIHVAVIPKAHVESVLAPEALDGRLLTAMVSAVQKVTHILGLDKTGFYVRFNAGKPDVTPHLHWHVLPLEPKGPEGKPIVRNQG
jgi:histidine triad (HIT) family protein